ncbi:MAG TPA: alkaline phosphatase family protein [Methanotrichaceae archaeon]|nr:MAG: Type I phosphodiesterase / nucleotide pyrophosphatase [Methanosaeta sp. PtaU1.Bin028]HOT07063.1 alkaline phosphatase family protein [Methanotrichaceae archaeon]HQF17102.1 alkaline phosphatase family protein [Methanotrichaceae archaeon]HQI91723.1 alkaline phosphatase family protein [Methanotrichaceae archaeon]HQJ28946.1 alkaline phosphatase family protein [Methanotrichaceae archaeon]
MPVVSQIDIAPTISRLLDFALPRTDGQPLEELGSWSCEQVVLSIVDSLGFRLYRYLEKDLKHLPSLAAAGQVFSAVSVSSHTSPAIASILSGLLPEHHGIRDTEDARRSPIQSIPALASSAGIRTGVIMEKGGAEVYCGLVEYIGAVPRILPPAEFDRQSGRLAAEALAAHCRLVVAYFIGLDKAAHDGQDQHGFRQAAMTIDRSFGQILAAAPAKTAFLVVGDHPVHAGSLASGADPRCVALLAGCL